MVSKLSLLSEDSSHLKRMRLHPNKHWLRQSASKLFLNLWKYRFRQIDCPQTSSFRRMMRRRKTSFVQFWFEANARPNLSRRKFRGLDKLLPILFRQQTRQ